MAGRYTHIQEFNDFRGEDLRSSDILRPRGFSKGSKNCLHTPQGGVTQRPGSHIMQAGYARFGHTEFETTDLLGITKKELIGFGSSSTEESAVPWRLVKSTFTLTNNHATEPATVTMIYDTVSSKFRFKIVRIGTLINQDLGIGTEVGPYMLSTLETAVDLLTSFAMSTPANGSTVPAAFMELIADKVIAAAGGTLVVNYWYWERVNASPFIQSFETTDVSTANETISLTYLSSQAKRYRNILRTGDIVRFFNTGGGLPAPLVAGTDYFVINANINTIQVSLTSGGAAINITTQGTGQHYIKCTTSNIATLKNYALNMGQTSQHNVSSAVINRVLYMPSGLGDIKTNRVAKYDGQQFYGTGLPIGVRIVAVAGLATGSFTDAKGTLNRVARTFAAELYSTSYRYIDKAGNVFEGALSSADSAGPSGSVVSQVQWSRTLGLNDIGMTGANQAYAVTTAGATSLTAAVDDGAGGAHTLQAGDIGYFWDNRQGRFIQRLIASRTNSQIVFTSESLDTDTTSPNYDDGLTPTFLAEAAISANLRIVLWRTNDGVTVPPYRAVVEIPWCPIYASYYDDSATPTNAPEFVEPVYPPEPLPACADLTSFNDLLIMFGDPKHPNTYRFSDLENVESSPEATHGFDIPVRTSGAKQSGDVLNLFGHHNYIGVMAGDLSNFAFRVDRIADHIGTFNQGGIQQVGEAALFFPTQIGPHVLVNGRELRPLGATKYPDGKIVCRIEPFFSQLYQPTVEQPCFERCTAHVIKKDQLYVLFIPFEDPAKPGFATSNSVTWVFDYGRDAWWDWTGLDMSGGVSSLEDVVYWSSRSHDGNVGVTNANVVSRFSQQQRLKGKYNYADHNNFTDWDFPMHWESLGRPGQFKRFIRVRLSSHEERLASSVQIVLSGFIDYDLTAQVDDNTLTWTTDLDLTPKVGGNVVRSRLFGLTSQRYYEPFPLSGLELEAVANFRQVVKE